MVKKPKLYEPSKELTTIEKRKLTSLEDIIDEHVGSFVKVGAALAEIRDSGFYLLLAETFDEYVQIRWPQQLSTRHANKLIQATAASMAVEGLEIAPPSGETNGASKPHRKPHSGGVVGEDINLKYTAALELSKVPDDAKKADVLQKAAELSKCKGGVLDVTKNAIKKAAESLGLVKSTPKPVVEVVAVEAELIEDEDLPVDERMQLANKQLDSACRAVTKSFKDNVASLADEMLWLQDKGRLGTAEASIRSAMNTIRSCKGAAICPKCDGEGCKPCHQTGWIDNALAKQLT